MEARPILRSWYRAGLALTLAWLAAGCGWRPDSVQAVDALIYQGKTDRALGLAEGMLSHELPGTKRYWELVLRRAQALEGLNRREEASFWLQSLRVPAAPRDLATLLIREQAAIESDLGHYSEADQHLREAISLARDSHDGRMMANLEVRRAKVLIRTGDEEEAERSLAAAEQYTLKTADHSLDPYILHYRGLARLMTNQFEDAIPPLEISQREFLSAKQNSLAANVKISLGSCYYHLGRLDKALSLYQEALSLATPGDRHLCLGEMGNILFDQHDYEHAAGNYQQAASLVKGRNQYYYSQWLINLTAAQLEQGKWPEAERSSDEALALTHRIKSSSILPQALVNSGRIEVHKGNYRAAENILRQVTAAPERDPASALDAYSVLADLYAQLRKFDTAERQYKAALHMADASRSKLEEDENKLSYLARLIDLHRHYVDFLVDRGRAAEAFAVAESSRARLLRERVNLLRGQPATHALSEYVAASRASDTTFLAYWIGWERSYLWMISGTRFATFRLPGEPEIRQLVDRYQGALENREADAVTGARLFELLLAQHNGLLKPRGKYLVVPDGPLYALNFETLPVPGGRPHFWIEDATVAVAPSLDLLLEHRATRERGRSLLLVGDATEWSAEYPRLLHAQKEMEGIEKQFQHVRPKILAGAEATPVAYQRSKPEDYAYIHFTAHATANKNSPFDSAIILARDSGLPGQGKLSVKEVLGTRLHAELVTISACHSAGARTYWGEGLVGFTWAFLQSGAKGVIAGLWDVSDYSSPRLMQDLYAGLAASKGPAVALREAKLRMIAENGKYSGPYYWGAFQLYEGSF